MAVFDPRARTELVEALSAQLSTRRASAFAKLGVEVCRLHVDAAVSALERDLEFGTRELMRTATIALLAQMVPEGLSFSDLRFFAGSLRTQALIAAPEDQRAALEQWCYEHLSVCTTHFMVRRDDQIQRKAAQRDIERFETQLAQLRDALDDKTRLLEMIRQASTPIAPVVRGIVVVPLVGTFDRFRAEILTEQLLDALARNRTRVAILDISGVPVFDTDAAQLIIRLARSVQLLGAKVILVGMSPDNARTIVELGIDLSQLATRGTLQDGLAMALRSQRLKIVAC